MKPAVLLSTLVVFGTAASTSARAQSVAYYVPVVRTTGITYSSIAATGSSFPAWRNGASLDDNRSGATPIGFTFFYDGQAVTQFSISTNGFIDFSLSTATGGGGVGVAYGFQNSQFSAVGGTLLALAPLYDDLIVASGGSLAGSFKYLTTGAPGGRVLTVEWINVEPFNNASADLNFQVKLHEASGVVEMVYGWITGAGATTYTCGINGPAMSAPPTSGELLTQQTANSADFSNTPQNGLATPPESNTMVTFTPAQNVTPASPTAITFSSVTQTGMTVGWTDGSSTETFFALYRSADGIIFSLAGTVPSTTTGSTGTTYSIVLTGLFPGTTYTLRITANNEGSPPSGFLEGSSATSPSGEVLSIASGSWNDPATWSSGAVPSATDNVTVADDHTVTMHSTAVCLNLTVGQGLSGVLLFSSGGAVQLTVGQNITISPGAVLQTPASGSTETYHVLSVAGDLANDGTLDLSTNGNTAGATLAFSGAGSAAFSGTGAVTDLRHLVIDKGTSPANVVEITTSNLTVRGVGTDVAGFVTLMGGTLKISGSFTMANRLFTTANYSIAAAHGIWLDNPNFTVAGQNGSVMVTGVLRISNGTFNAGTAPGNSIAFLTGSAVTVEGGAVNVAGRWGVGGATNAITYVQSGGTLTVSTAGNASTSLASFDLGKSASTSVTMAGGAIVVRKAGTGASGPRDYRNLAGTQSISGGTLQLGDAGSGAPQTFRLQGSIPNLEITSTSSAHTGTLLAQAHVVLDATVESSAMLDLNGNPLVLTGSTLMNDGTIDGALPGSRLAFLGSGSAQTYTGSGTMTLDVLSIDNPAGVTIDNAAQPVTALRVNLVRGLLTNASQIILGQGGTSSCLTQIGAPGQTSPGGNYDSFPVFNVGSGGYSIVYAQESAPRTTGFEIPPTRAISSMTIDNTGGVTLAGGDLTLSTGLTLTAGLLTTGANTLAITSTGNVVRTSGHVVGNLQKAVSETLLARTFEIGSSDAYTPVSVTFSSVSTAGDLKMTTVNGDHPHLDTSGLNGATTANRYYAMTNSGIVFTSAQGTFNWAADDVDPGSEPASFVLGQFNGGAWTFPTTTGNTTTSIDALDLTSFSDFAAGNIGLSIADVAIIEGNADTTNAEFAIMLGAPPQSQVSFNYETADGTATSAGGDYVAISPPQPLVFNPGDPLIKTVSVTVHGDFITEPDETFFLNLSSPSGATFVDNQGTGTILNDDGAPVISVDDVAVMEGNLGPVLATFTVTLSNPSKQLVTVDYKTIDSTAVAGSGGSGDYVAIAPPQTLSFNPGEPVSQVVSVTVNGDLITELDEVFFLELSNAVNATIADSLGDGTIQNDDGVPAISIDDVAIAEGDLGDPVVATFTVALSNPSKQVARVDYETGDDTAKVLDGDYVAITPAQTLTFNPGEPLSQMISVTVNGDMIIEPDETFFVNLSNATNATIADAQGAGTIVDDDGTTALDETDSPAVEATYVGDNFPNPFAGETTVPVGLREASHVRMRVYDTRGRLVRTLVDGMLAAGVQRVTWDGRDGRGARVSSGFYIVRVEAAGDVFSRPLRIVR